MIEYVSGDLLESEMQTLVNPVNTVGVMGAGLALQFAKVYPEMIGPYKALCQSGVLIPGVPWLYKSASKWVYNFPTKKHWHDLSELRFIDWGLARFVRTYEFLGITSIAFPKLGCGLGGLNWNDVKPVMEAYLMPLDLNVQIYTGR